MQQMPVDTGIVPQAAHNIARFLAISPDAGLGPFFGTIIASIIAACVALTIAVIFTRRIKRTEVTIECSKRFQDILEAQHKLNRDFYFESSGNPRDPVPQPSARDKADALNWYRKFFSLIESEYHFRRDHLLSQDRFVAWMKWRRNDYANVANLVTCGVNYREGWDWWKSRLALTNNSFVLFLDSIHEGNSASIPTICRSIK